MYPKHIVTLYMRLRPYTSIKWTRDTAINIIKEGDFFCQVMIF